MNFIVSGRNINVTQALRDKAESKLSKLNKFFDEDTDVNVTFNVEKNDQIVEVTIPFKGMIFRAEQSNSDMYTSIDKVIDVLERQIVKNKKRLEKRFKGEHNLKFDHFDFIHEENDFDTDDNQITKIKRFSMKPMSSEEAILQMNLLGHEFFMFRNSDNSHISVIYQRSDGNYGLIEPTE